MHPSPAAPSSGTVTEASQGSVYAAATANQAGGSAQGAAQQRSGGSKQDSGAKASAAPTASGGSGHGGGKGVHAAASTPGAPAAPTTPTTPVSPATGATPAATAVSAPALLVAPAVMTAVPVYPVYQPPAHIATSAPQASNPAAVPGTRAAVPGTRAAGPDTPGPAPAPAHPAIGVFGEPMVLAQGAWQGLSLHAATELKIPIGLLVGAGLFLVVQGFVDRRDPKVSAAPLRGTDDTVGFE